MAKRILTLIMLLATALVARAFDFSQQAPTGQTLYYSVNGNEASVVNPDWDYYTKPSGSLQIPSTIEHSGVTYQVTAIGASAFEECTGLTRVVVPEGVTAINGFAFYRCSSLDTIELPSTLTEILSQAFTYTAYASNSANRDTFGVLYIGAYLIGGGNVPQIIVRDGTLGIASMAFYYNHTLEHITLPSTLRFVSGLSFADCIALDTVRCLSEVPPHAVGNPFQQAAAFTLAVPCGTSAAYAADPVWGAYNIVEDCSSQPVSSVMAPVPQVVRVSGGLMVSGVEGRSLAVSDIMGRRVATVPAALAAQRIAIPAAGVYLLTVEGSKPVKILYSE